MVVLEFSMVPLGKEGSLSAYIARCLDIVDQSGLEYQCGVMGTTVEGEFDEVLDVVKQCFEVLRTDCDRIDGNIHFDFRQGTQGHLASSVSHVEQTLGRLVMK